MRQGSDRESAVKEALTKPRIADHTYLPIQRSGAIKTGKLEVSEGLSYGKISPKKAKYRTMATD